MKMNSLRGLLFLLILFSGSIVFGQTITGTVTGDNFPLPGVNIAVEGTQKGAVTDFDGLYSIDGVQEGDVLIFSSIGFATKKVTAIGNAVIDVNLEEDVTALEDVVVVGYTQTTREKLTTAVSSVGAEALAEIPAASVNEALEGRASGVQVSSNGSPGEESAVIIRGISTFGNGRPLYVVDGVFVESVSQISPEAIAKVDILKDAAASAVYGSRASNGVIIITTKKGKAGKPKFDFSAYTGVQFFDSSKLPDLLSGPDLVNLLKTEDLDNTVAGNQSLPRFDDPDFVPTNENFVNDLYRTALTRNFNVNASGGSDKATFSMNAGYFDQEGTLIDTRFRRYTLNLNSDFKINDYFKVGQTLNTGLSITTLPDLIQGFIPLQAAAVNTPNYIPAVTPDGVFSGPLRSLDNNGLNGNQFNALLQGSLLDQEQQRFSLNASVFAEIKLAKGLTNKTTIAASYLNDQTNTQIDAIIPDGPRQNAITDNFQVGQLRFLNQNTITTTFTNQLSYNKSFGSHDLGVSAIFERIDREETLLEVDNRDRIDNTVDEIGDGSTSLTGTVTFPDILTSYVGLLNYSYGDRYFVSGSLRRDASSLFAEPVGIFPSASAAWIISNESFFDSVGFVSNLKLRYGLGVTGNNRIRPFRDEVRLETTQAVDLEGNTVNAATFAGIVQDRLTWETSTKQNIGFDLGLFSDKIKFGAEYYTNDSENLIAFLQNSASAGNNDFGNVGETTVDGFDFSAEYNDTVGDFKWGVWAQLSTVNTEVTALNLDNGTNELFGAEFSPFDGATGNGISRLEVGQPIWGIYGNVTDGLYRNDGEVIDGLVNDGIFVNTTNGEIVEKSVNNGVVSFADGSGNAVDRSNIGVSDNSTLVAGDIRFVDVNGDGVLNDDDVTLIGDPNPDFTYSLSLNASYKGFDFSALFKGVQGVDALNGVSIITRGFAGNNATDVSVLDRFTPANVNASQPRFSLLDQNSNRRISDRFIEDASYLRLRSLVLGYSFNNNVLDSILSGSLSKLRFYVQGQNLFTITDYSGLDPEIRPSYTAPQFFGDISTIGGLGVDRGTQPAPISVIFGIQVGF